MKKYVVEPGTMLYDVDGQMLGWVVDKHNWPLGQPHDDWDVEWTNGKREYYSVGSLQFFIRCYIMLEEDNDKR